MVPHLVLATAITVCQQQQAAASRHRMDLKALRSDAGSRRARLKSIQVTTGLIAGEPLLRCVNVWLVGGETRTGDHPKYSRSRGESCEAAYSHPARRYHNRTAVPPTYGLGWRRRSRLRRKMIRAPLRFLSLTDSGHAHQPASFSFFGPIGKQRLRMAVRAEMGRPDILLRYPCSEQLLTIGLH